jgi:hypothetical protein
MINRLDRETTLTSDNNIIKCYERTDLPKKDITLSGADGSGKTTVSRLLVSVLSNHGYVCFHWFRGSHLFASLLYRLLSRFSSFRGVCNPYYGVCVPVKLRPLWVHVKFWSLIPHVIVRFILRRFCRVLVCDRGFMDFIVWVIVTLEHPSFLSSIYGRFLLRITALGGPFTSTLTWAH